MRPTATQFLMPERLSVAVMAMSFTTFAQTDEIQVYDAEIAARGMFNLMVYTDFTRHAAFALAAGLSRTGDCPIRRECLDHVIGVR